MIAIVEAMHAGLFGRGNISRNIVAGLVIAVIALPLSMAFAIASGAKPEAGIYSSIIAVVIVSLFGGSRVQISGPTSAFVGVLIGVSSKYGLEGLQIATILAGIIMFFLGVFKCGMMIKFIPEQVVAGFTAGIAVNMVTAQIPNFFGIKCGLLPPVLHEKFIMLAKVAHTTDLPTTCLALVSLLLLYVCQKPKFNKVPGPLVVLIFGMIVQAVFHCPSIATIGSVFGGLSNKLPSFTPTTTLSLHTINKLLAPAFVIAILGSIESLLCAIIADGLIGTKHSSNQELIGHGLANMISPMFGGIASTGSIARTVASIKVGGNSPLAGIVSAIILCFVICFLAPLAKFVPLSSLAAILFMVGARMANFKHLYDLFVHAPKSDTAILVLTFLLTIFSGIIIAVNAGVMLSALMLMHRMSDSSSIDRIAKGKHAGYDFSQVPHGIAIYVIMGPIFFGMIDKFSKAFSSIENEDKIIILRMFDVPFIDATGLENLKMAISLLKKRGKTVLLSEVNNVVMMKLQRSRMIDSFTMSVANKPILEVIDIANNIITKEK